MQHFKCGCINAVCLADTVTLNLCTASQYIPPQVSWPSLCNFIPIYVYPYIHIIKTLPVPKVTGIWRANPQFVSNLFICFHVSYIQLYTCWYLILCQMQFFTVIYFPSFPFFSWLCHSECANLVVILLFSLHLVCCFWISTLSHMCRQLQHEIYCLLHTYTGLTKVSDRSLALGPGNTRDGCLGHWYSSHLLSHFSQSVLTISRLCQLISLSENGKNCEETANRQILCLIREKQSLIYGYPSWISHVYGNICTHILAIWFMQLLCLLLFFKVHFLYGIFYRHELVIRHQLSQGLSPHLAVFPSACPLPAPSAAASGCQPRKADSQASRSSRWGSSASHHRPAAAQHRPVLPRTKPAASGTTPTRSRNSLLVYGNFSFFFFFQLCAFMLSVKRHKLPMHSLFRQMPCSSTLISLFLVCRLWFTLKLNSNTLLHSQHCQKEKKFTLTCPLSFCADSMLVHWMFWILWLISFGKSLTVIF